MRSLQVAKGWRNPENDENGGTVMKAALLVAALLVAALLVAQQNASSQGDLYQRPTRKRAFSFASFGKFVGNGRAQPWGC